MVPFVCPACHTSLTDNITDLTCSTCGQMYPVTDNIPRFAPSDPFYEEARPGSGVYPAQHDTVRHGLKKILFPLYQRMHLNLRTQHFQDRILDRAEGPILDAGCGGGNGHLGRFGEVTGVDISLKALREAGKVYPQTGQASLARLPFANDTFGTIVCNHVLEHLPPEIRDQCLREFYRVLRPGGILLAAVPVAGDNILYRRAMIQQDLYNRFFIQAVGHHGLSSPDDLQKRMERAGFRIDRMVSAYSVIWPVGTYVRFYDNEYRKDSPILGTLVRLDRLAIAVSPLCGYTADKLLHVILGVFSGCLERLISIRASSLVNIHAVRV